MAGEAAKLAQQREKEAYEARQVVVLRPTDPTNRAKHLDGVPAPADTGAPNGTAGKDAGAAWAEAEASLVVARDVLDRVTKAILDRQDILSVPREDDKYPDGMDLAEAVGQGFDDLRLALQVKDARIQALEQALKDGGLEVPTAEPEAPRPVVGDFKVLEVADNPVSEASSKPVASDKKPAAAPRKASSSKPVAKK